MIEIKQNSFQKKLKYQFIASVVFVFIMLCIMYFNMSSTAKESKKFNTALNTITSIENITASVKKIDDKLNVLSPINIVSFKNLFIEEIDNINIEKETLKTSFTNNENIQSFFELVSKKTNALDKILKIRESIKKDTIIFNTSDENEQKYSQNIVTKQNEITKQQRDVLVTTNIEINKYAKQLNWILFTLALSFFFFVINGYFLLSKNFKKSDSLNVSKKVKLEVDLIQLSKKLQKDIDIKSNDLNNFFERIADAFFILDNNWNYVYLNKTALSFHQKTEAELIGKNIWTLYPNMVNGDLYNSFQQAKNTQKPIRKQFYYPDEDKWFEDLIYPDKDSVSVYYNEITNNKKADLSLKKALDKLSFHISNTPLAVLEFDSNLNILQWSKKAEDIFGWSEKEVEEEKLRMDKIIEKNDFSTFFESLNEITSGKKTTETLNNKCVTKKGEIIYCEWYNSFLKNENNNDGVMLCLVKDVTKNKKTEVELTNTESKFRSLVEQSLVGVYIRKRDRFLYVNPRLAEIFGYSTDEMYTVITIGDLIKKEEIAKIESVRTIKKNKGIQYEFEGIKKNKETFFAELFGNVTIIDGEEVVIGTVIDITEKKKATEKLSISEVALKESNEIFEMVAQATQDGIWNWDMESDILTGNAIFLSNFNLPVNSKLKFNDFVNKVHESDSARMLSNFKLALKNKDNLLTEEFKFHLGNNQYKNFLDRAYLLYNDEKRAYRMVGAMQDITKLKESEFKILKEKELSESTINSLPGIFFIANKQGKIHLWNKNFETITAYSTAELKKLKVLDLISEADRETVIEKVKTVFRNGTDAVEAYFRNKKGEKTPYYFTGTLISYENEKCLLGIGIDISDRVKSQQALINSEEKYRILFNKNPLPMWLLSETAGKFLDANIAAIKSYGYSKEEFLKLPIINLHPKEDKAFEKWKQRNDDLKYDEMFWEHQKKDGTIIKVHIVSNRFMYNGEETALALANDITNQVLADEKLQKSNEAFRELASKLEEVRESERTHMAREIHDELGQQLTGLKMDISWINKKIQSTDETVLQKMKETIQLIDKTVITVRRIATALRPSILDDLGLIAAMEWQCEEFEKRHEIKSTFTTNTHHILVSPEVATGVFRIFQESLTNVARHANATKVKSTFIFKDNNISLIIEDNGKGFDELEIAKKKTLGLLGMKERVLLINGTYQIKGNIGMGASVIINVPLN